MAKKRANGEGNIRKRKDGRWEGRYTAGYDEKTGKRLIKNVLGKTQAEVKEKLAKAVAEAESVDVGRADEYTLGTWLQTWYELYAKPHLRFSTAEYYRRGIELHITPRIGDIPLKKLTGRDLQGLYKDLREHGRLREAQKGKQPGLSDSTIRGIHTLLHNALARAVTLDTAGLDAGHGREIILNAAQYLPDAVLLRLSGKLVAALLAACTVYKLGLLETADNGFHVLHGRIRPVGDRLEGDIALIGAPCKVYHNTQGIAPF